MTDIDLLKEARERFKVTRETNAINRKDALEDMKFEHGEQWSDADKADRKGRPCLVINKVAGTVKQIVGDSRQNRIAIKVRPVDDNSDPEVAKIYTGLIRNIENISNAEEAYDYGFECAVRGGIGYWRVITDYADDDVFEQDVLVERIANPLSVDFDPEAIKPDFSDAMYCFISETLSREKYEAKYSKKEVITADWEDDQETWLTDEIVRIAEYFYKEPATKNLYMLQDGRMVQDVDPMDDGAGNKYIMTETGPLFIVKERKVNYHKVMWCKVSGNAVIEKPREWPGKYIPVVPCLGEEIFIEGRRILRSAIRHAKDPQRLYNWARSNSVETLALAPKQPFILTPEQVEGHENEWNTANTTPRPYLLYNETNSDRPQREGGSITDTGAANEAMIAADDIKATTGLHDASLGKQGNETSGKAILARQREGDTATFIFTDNQARAIKYTGKILVDLIPKIYDTPRVVRLLNEDGKEGWAQINQDVETPNGPQKVMDISKGRYDVVVDVGPNYATKRIEAAEGMVQMVQAAPLSAPAVIPRLAKNLDWPEADEIAEELKALLQPQPQQPDPLEQRKGELDIQGKEIANAQKMQQMQQGIDMEQFAQLAQQVTVQTLQQLGIIGE